MRSPRLHKDPRPNHAVSRLPVRTFGNCRHEHAFEEEWILLPWLNVVIQCLTEIAPRMRTRSRDPFEELDGTRLAVIPQIA
jgi:hypothetical protein